MKEFLSQAAKLLKEHKLHRRQLKIFLCLAVIVAFGTVTALKLYGQAMTHQMEVLACKYEVHEHTEECYEKDEQGNPVGEPICGYADYVIHTHNEDCLDGKGNLVCTLEEHEKHEHTDECYEIERVPICGLEETEAPAEDAEGTPEEEASTAGTEGTPEEEAPAAGSTPDAGSQPETGSAAAAEPAQEETLVCQTEAHAHDESCYEKALSCGHEEHAHGEGCTTQELTCGTEEHAHGEGCATKELTCGAEEHAHVEGCYDEEGNLTCGMQEHAHGEGCYTTTYTCGHEEHTHGESCYTAKYTCGMEEHTHDDSCYTSNLICGKEEHEHTEGCYESVTVPAAADETAEPAEGAAPSEGTTGADNGADAAPAEPTEPESDAAEESVPTGHVHTDECYEEVKTLICGEQELHVHDNSCYAPECFDEEGNLIEGSLPFCGLLQLEEHVHVHTDGEDSCFQTVELTPEEIAALENGATLHIHTEECYDGEGNLICGHDATHIHMPQCYDDAGELICGYGTASHVHEDKCYDEGGNLICGYETASHVHEESCYDADGNLQCGYETAKHVHEENCYDTEGNLTCGYETASHVHEESCYDEEGNLQCGYETASHVHEESCYDEDGNLICGYETASHVHEENCYDEDGNLICGYETASHLHKESCYDEEGKLVCGYETASHPHTKDCYDEEGNLVCGYETASHLHKDSCYDEEGNLVCGYETASHVHNDSCYNEDGNLICGYKTASHVHDDDCYDEEGNLICGYETASHIHEDSCYDEEGNLICGYEDANAHEHDASCYDEEGNLICGYDGAKNHEHDAECYDEEGNLICGYKGVKKHEHDATCYDENDRLVCGYKGAKKHEHDARCYDEEGNLTCGYEGVKDHEHDAGCYDILDNLICGYEGVKVHEHTESCYDEEGNLICGYEVPEMYDNIKHYEGERYIVVVKYNNDAKIPDEAELIAEEITSDSNESHYEEREAEYQKAMKDTNATMRALLKIGFYLDDVEVEPATPVAVTVQFLDEDGLAEGKPITIVHFAEDGIEKLDGTDAKDNSTTFTMGSFSEIAIGYSSDENEKLVKDGKLYISNDFEVDVDPFHIVFHVEGEPKTMDGESVIIELPDADDDKEDMVAPSNSETSGEEKKPVLQKLKFYVKSLDDDIEIREALVAYIGESTETVSRNILTVLSYSMAYGDIELDLSDCMITAEITMSAETAETSMEDESTEEGNSTIESENPAMDISEEESSETATIVFQDTEVVKEITENPETVQTLKGVLTGEDTDTEISIKAIGFSQKNEVTTLDEVTLGEEKQKMDMNFSIDSGIMAITEVSTANPTFKVQYYAYVQKMPTTNPGNDAEAISIIDTVKKGMDGVKGGAQLPDNSGKPNTRFMYVKPSSVKPYTANWIVYDPVYIDKNSTDALTKIYTADLYEFREVASGLEHINKFAKEGLNYDLFEVWVLNDQTKVNSTGKDGWTVYSGEDIQKLVFRNNNVSEEGMISVQIKADTVIRLVGKSNEEVNKNYPTRFFDYDFSNGTKNIVLQGINNPLNYKKDASGAVIMPRYGFGNTNSGDKNNGGGTGLGFDNRGNNNNYALYINRAKTKKKEDPNNVNEKDTSTDTIIEKCFFGLTQKSLSSEGYPVINANAPDLFNPKNKEVVGKTEVSGYSLNFSRDGDTYTLTSVNGSGNFAQNLNQFQKAADKAYGTQNDAIWTNQFWPMDSAPTFGDTAKGHDPKFGTEAQKKQWGFVTSDDGKEHNSFFGMAFDVEFELTDDYVGPLNYYFFGDDDMWVFLEHPDGTTELICDIGGVHQAAGEYVDLWNYIQKPEDNVGNGTGNSTGGENSDGNTGEEDKRTNPKYKLKFFYTERGASGSTCWMQFTLPSVNAVPVIDYTGNVKSTLTLGKSVEGAETDERFDFTIEFSGSASNIASNDYPYRIKNEDGSLVESGDIRSGGTFKLGNKQTIEVFNLPDGTKYVIKEKEYAGYEPDLGKNNTSGMITKDKTVEGNIDWKKDDIVDYINREVEYNLPETGGTGTILYTMAGGIVLLFGAGFLYKKKFRERRG